MEVFHVYLNHNDFVDNLQFQRENYRECRTKLFYLLSSVGLDKPYLEKLKDDFQMEIKETVSHHLETPISRSKKKHMEE